MCLSALVLGLIVSCGGGGNDDTAGIPPIDIGDAVALGHGTDIFGTYASSDNIKAPVLDLVALNGQGMLSIDPNVEEATFISTSGTTISEYASSLGVSVGVSGQYKFFTASIDTRFESEFYSREEFAFATVQELYKKSALKVGEQYRGEELINFLTPEARQALATWTPDRIVAAYGTHVMVGIYEELMWAKKLEGADAALDPNTRAHYDAWLQHIIPPLNNNLVHAGYSDWRMPSFDEIWSLVDQSRAPEALVDDRFGMIDSLYWSSTVDDLDPAKLRVLLLSDGRTSALSWSVPRAYDTVDATTGAAIFVRDAY